jgi:hypothetical protein
MSLTYYLKCHSRRGNTPWPFHPAVVQRHLETKVANCVGGVLSPLLANVALAALDDHFRVRWSAMGTQSQRRRAVLRGAATYRLIRYADDFVVLVNGSRDHAESLYRDLAEILAPLGLRLAPDKTKITTIDEGFDFLGATRGRMVRASTLIGGLRPMTAA